MSDSAAGLIADPRALVDDDDDVAVPIADGLITDLHGDGDVFSLDRGFFHTLGLQSWDISVREALITLTIANGNSEL